MSHALSPVSPTPTPCDPFGPAPDYDSPTQSAFNQAMVLGQDALGNAEWQHLHKRVHYQNGGVLAPGYDLYAIGDTGSGQTVTLWSPLALDLCGQNEVWIKNNSTFDLTIALAGGSFDFASTPATLILPGKSGVLANQGGASVHLICEPGTANWLVVASHNM